MRETVAKIVKYTSTPLQGLIAIILILTFFAGFLAWKSNLAEADTTLTINRCLMIIVGIVIIIIVLLLKYPKSLVFDKEAYITIMRERLGDSIGGEYSPLDIKQIQSPPLTIESTRKEDGEGETK